DSGSRNREEASDRLGGKRIRRSCSVAVVCVASRAAAVCCDRVVAHQGLSGPSNSLRSTQRTSNSAALEEHVVAALAVIGHFGGPHPGRVYRSSPLAAPLLLAADYGHCCECVVLGALESDSSSTPSFPQPRDQRRTNWNRLTHDPR